MSSFNSFLIKTIKRGIISLMAGILISPAPVYSQAKNWRYKECLDFALEHNISLQQNQLNNEITGYDLEKAKADLLPNLNFSGSHQFLFGGQVDPYTGVKSSDNNSSTNYSLNSGVTLFNGFQNSNTIRMYETEEKSNAYDIEKQKNDMMLNIFRAYLSVLLGKEQVLSARIQLQNSEALVERAQKLVQSGTKPMNDLLQVKSQLATDKYSLTQALNSLQIAKVTLMQFMELPVDSTFEISSPAIDDNLVLSSVMQSSQIVYDTAVQVLPEIKSSAIKIETSRYFYQIAKGAFLPQVSLSGSLGTGYSSLRSLYNITPVATINEIGYLASNPAEKVLADQIINKIGAKSYPYGSQLKDNISSSLGISISIPIFNRKQAKTNLNIAGINLKNAELTLQNTRNQLRKEIEQNSADFIASRNKYFAAVEQVSASKESYKNAEAKFNLGMLSSTDLITEKKTFTQAELNYIQAKYESLFQSKISDFYQGREIVLQ
jgi:outer membrane protein